LAVNWLGSGGLGLLLASRQSLPEWVWLGLVTGLCGALTTFSTCLVEAAQWIRMGFWLRALAYLVATFGGGIFLILLALKRASEIF
jgi:CrcB protein